MKTPINPYRELKAIKPIVYPPPDPKRDNVVKKLRKNETPQWNNAPPDNKMTLRDIKC